MTSRPLGAHQYRIADKIGPGQALEVFIAPDCARCRTKLADRFGNPRWEIQGQLTFVCLGGCPEPAIRKAWQS